MRAALAIVQKDLRIEWRTRETAVTLAVLGVLLVTVLTFAHDPAPAAAPLLVPAVLWSAMAFTGLLGVERGFLLEREQDCLAGLRGAPIDPSALYVGADVFCGPDVDNLEFTNTAAFVLRKSDLLNPATPANLAATAGAVTAFRALVSVPTGPGMLSPQGVDRPEPTAGVGYFVGVDNEFLGRLVLRTVSNPGSGAMPRLGFR